MIAVCHVNDEGVQATVQFLQGKFEHLSPICTGHCWASIDACRKGIIGSDKESGWALATSVKFGFEADSVEIWP